MYTITLISEMNWCVENDSTTKPMRQRENPIIKRSFLPIFFVIKVAIRVDIKRAAPIKKVEVLA